MTKTSIVFIPAIDSATTEAMYQLEKDFPEQVFDDGLTSDICQRKLQG